MASLAGKYIIVICVYVYVRCVVVRVKSSTHMTEKVTRNPALHPTPTYPIFKNPDLKYKTHPSKKFNLLNLARLGCRRF